MAKFTFTIEFGLNSNHSKDLEELFQGLPEDWAFLGAIAETAEAFLYERVKEKNELGEAVYNLFVQKKE